jgi:stearoyl-CoA desaturase (delta-9 desaturase)
MNETVMPRSQAIARTWESFNWGSAFSAIIYPALGLIVLAIGLAIGFGLPQVEMKAWYLIPALGAFVFCTVLCNIGIGTLHRIWHHRAGEMAEPVQPLVAIGCILAMQGPLKDWVNYHTMHHRYSDAPGDPHNPNEGRFWAWIGWVLWRDPADMDKPIARWLERNRAIRWADGNYMPLSVVVHLLIPIALYATFYLLGWPLLLALFIHAATVIARGLHFHATTLGVNVVGHIDAPEWVNFTLAVATGGEAIHGHHHSHPRSLLHLPRKGIVNRLIDYNGTFLLALQKVGLVRNTRIAPQFA